MYRVWTYIGFFVLFLSVSIITNPPFCWVEVSAHLTVISIITGIFVLADEILIKIRKRRKQNE